MALGTRLQRWWQRIRGEEQPSAQPVLPAAKGNRPTTPRPVTRIEGTGPDGELKLSVEEKPAATPAGKKRRASAGFDPYAHSGGFPKPKGWDDVPRK